MKKLILLILFLTLCINCAYAKEFAALLHRVRGQVLFARGGTKVPKWRKARPGMGLEKGDLIKTGARSHAKIMLESGAYYWIRAKSEIELSKLIYNRKRRRSRTRLTIRKGLLFGKIKKLMRNSKTSIKTPTAIVAIRGTELAAEVVDEKTTHIALFEGRIVVTDFVQESGLPGDQGLLLLNLLHEVDLKANEAVTVTDDGIKKTKLKDRMDAWKKDLKTLRDDFEEAEEELKEKSPEDENTRRQKIRQEVLKEE